MQMAAQRVRSSAASEELSLTREACLMVHIFISVDPEKDVVS